MGSLNDMGADRGLPNDWFNAYSVINLYADVLNAPTATTLKCTGNNCLVNACWHFTPIFSGITPSVVYPGQKVTYLVDPRAAKNY
jgi:hypothetical protein